MTRVYVIQRGEFMQGRPVKFTESANTLRILVYSSTILGVFKLAGASDYSLAAQK